ncbi:phage tail family protein [Bacillus thuringiensis]|uniref:phage tail family protein n=1 Tax=Bacillus thuringiensis TaxID=1428 RepID=UPI000BFC989F|nr:phage tail family protein [Bacillus thuringiensis]MED4447450.1 phage tail family protein [Bacillus cereus]PGU35143.1 phage tail protein [Bacillus thuringiensis]
MYLIIQRLNGETYKTHEQQLKLLDLAISSPHFEPTYDETIAMDGEIDLGVKGKRRVISATFDFTAVDSYDYPLFRNKIFKIFNSREQFYLIDSREPGKRWLVRTSPYTPAHRNFKMGRFDMEFVSARTYCESIGTTLTSLTSQAGVWQIGQGLSFINSTHQYIFDNIDQFEVFNPSDVTVDPQSRMDIKIQYTGPSTNLKIENLTTGDSWSYTGTTTAGNIISLEGIRSFKSGISIFRDTNHKIIKLAPGINKFKITGATGTRKITFDFRFYYL